MENGSPREILIEKINYVERTYPVDTWQINGLKVWPYIRLQLADSQTQLQMPDDKARKRDGFLKNLLLYFSHLLRFPFHYWRFRNKIKGTTRLFVGGLAHRVAINGELINKFFDYPVREFENKGESAVIVEHSVKHYTNYFNQHITFNLSILYALVPVRARLSRLFGKQPDVNLPGYEEFYSWILRNFEYTDVLREKFSTEALTGALNKMFFRKQFLKKAIYRTAVSRAYFLCYYTPEMMPLVAACNELRITTIDIQHGGMGKGHYAYDSWLEYPADGYTLLPDYFWTWDTYSARLINSWAGGTKRHRAVTGGNTWTDTVMQLYNAPLAYSNHILINMNRMTINELVLDAIKHFKDKETWVLRMHPRQYQNRDVLERQIREENIEAYVTIEDPISVPLPVSLLYCKHLVSASSGTVIEAIDMGIKPVLLRSPGFVYYQHYIEENKVLVLKEENSRELIRLLKELNALPQEKRQYTQVNESKFLSFERAIAAPGNVGTS